MYNSYYEDEELIKIENDIENAYGTYLLTEGCVAKDITIGDLVKQREKDEESEKILLKTGYAKVYDRNGSRWHSIVRVSESSDDVKTKLDTFVVDKKENNNLSIMFIPNFAIGLLSVHDNVEPIEESEYNTFAEKYKSAMDLFKGMNATGINVHRTVKKHKHDDAIKICDSTIGLTISQYRNLMRELNYLSYRRMKKFVNEELSSYNGTTLAFKAKDGFLSIIKVNDFFVYEDDYTIGIGIHTNNPVIELCNGYIGVKYGFCETVSNRFVICRAISNEEYDELTDTIEKFNKTLHS